MKLGPEYLHFNPIHEIPSHEDIISSQSIISPKPLILLLNDAHTYLTEVPGPNITMRQLFATSWLKWWIDYLSTLESHSSEMIHSEKINTSLAMIKERVEQEHINGKTSGLLLMGGGEGTDAHRHAQDWVAEHVDVPILLFEEPDYVENKSRGGRFLPLSIGLSMWALYPNTGLIGLVPENNESGSLNGFYQSVHDQTGVQYHFVSDNDLNWEQKAVRGKFNKFCFIPFLNTPSTTDRTQRLMP